MILSETYEFAYIHIPKCAGTSVKLANPGLEGTTQLNVARHHKSLPTLEWPLPAHMPLELIEQYYPEEMEKIQSFESFAVMRDPLDRFCSAIMQHAREFGSLHSVDIGEDAVISIFNNVKNVVSKSNIDSNHKYVHFIEQNKYLELRNRRIIKNIDCTGDFSLINQFLLNKGLNPVQHKANASVVPKKGLFRRIVKTTKPVYTTVLPPNIKERIWRILLDIGLYESPSGNYDLLKGNEEVRTFVREFYWRDFEIWAELKGI